MYHVVFFIACHCTIYGAFRGIRGGAGCSGQAPIPNPRPLGEKGNRRGARWCAQCSAPPRPGMGAGAGGAGGQEGQHFFDCATLQSPCPVPIDSLTTLYNLCYHRGYCVSFNETKYG